MKQITLKDFFQMAAWAAAVIGVLIAAFKAIAEWRRDRRWKQAEMAKTCLDEIRNNELADAALRMLDWTGLVFKQPDGEITPQINHDQRRIALRVSDTFYPPGDPGPFIRDAFDALFDGFERLEHFIRINLIRFEDVAPPLKYYVSKMSLPEERPVMEAFLRSYGFHLALRFLDRFPSWKTGAAA